ncbi:hypothetical protein CLAVI_000524 [Candidatus Clavichlamydia salmonicola]|uniref:hypothetical protein n=1 Tax=Candidatus Clavichlamydia salmonicola TaxID=469812 RepID=UPI0018919B76|nr:hypothetical protein [Candidatus Clavichlamydia salmonicola]MBF5050902.1 hypothetical protein [Candidatus Clavichlamydia salmonicola]
MMTATNPTRLTPAAAPKIQYFIILSKDGSVYVCVEDVGIAAKDEEDKPSGGK